MNFKRSTTSMAIALLAVSLISVTSIQQDAFANTGLGMSLNVIADRASDTIRVTGTTTSDLTDITFRVSSPNDSIVSIGQITPEENGEFAIEFKIGPTWTEDGFYEILIMQTAHQTAIYSLDAEIEVVNGKTAKIVDIFQTNTQSTNLAQITENVTQDKGLVLDEIVIENGSSMFEVEGVTDRVNEAITLTISAPNGNVVSVDQISPMPDGEFSKVIQVGGPLWKQDGFYTVKAYQNDNPKYTASAEIDIQDGVVVPEFGTIAAMILAVAIISIIAVSAKSRLSIMPRI